MKRNEERKKCDLNENENDVLDLPSLEIVTFGEGSFMNCHVAVFESMWWLFIFISFLILDLPKLHTISFNGVCALAGDNRANSKTINGHWSFDNTLIMKSKLKWNEMKCELCFDSDCLDLPSLTKIQGNRVNIHRNMGYVILESMIWFDLIWIDIPNLTENNIHYGDYSFGFTADLQSTSTFPFHLHIFIFTF